MISPQINFCDSEMTKFSYIKFLWYKQNTNKAVYYH